MRKHIKGIDASPGVAVGKVFLYKEEELFIDRGEFENTEIQKERLIEGREKTKQQLLKIREKTALKLGEDKAAIFDGHITLLEDEDLFEEVEELIEEEKISAENALEQGIRGYCDMLSNLEDEYLRERAADLKDIAKRWLYNIAGIDIVDLSSLPENSIVVARDLTPSDTAQLDLNNVIAFVTDIGGKTAHSSIMARSLEIPAIVGTGNITELVKNRQEIIVDALTGDIIIEPSGEEKTTYLEKRKAYLDEKELLKQLKDSEAITEAEFEAEKAKILNSSQVSYTSNTLTDKKSAQGMVGFVLGLIGIIAWFLPIIGFPVTVLGIIFSSLGINSLNKNKATVGLILSIIFFILTLINSFLGVVMTSALYY